MERQSCCVNFYQNDVARFLLGDSWHPGGDKLTLRIGELSGIMPSYRVLDVACGIGTSAKLLEKHFQCKVIGIDAGKKTLAQASKNGGHFVQGYSESIPLKPASIDSVVIECALSTFANQLDCLGDIREILRPGGKVAISDMVVEGDLPSTFDEVIAQAACLAKAHSVDGYKGLLQEAEFINVQYEDHSDSLMKLVENIQTKIFGAKLFLKIKKPEIYESIDFYKVGEIIKDAIAYIKEGRLGYAVFIAEK